MKTTMTIENIDADQLLKDFQQLCEEDLLGLISKLIDMDGGRDLIMTLKERWSEQTVLHCACCNGNISMNVISKLLEVGGRELLMMKNRFGFTALHNACRNKKISMGIISKLLEVGGRE